MFNFFHFPAFAKGFRRGWRRLLPPLPHQVIQQERIDVACKGHPAPDRFFSGLVLQRLIPKAEQQRGLPGELLLFSSHLQNIRLFIVTSHAVRHLKTIGVG